MLRRGWDESLNIINMTYTYTQHARTHDMHVHTTCTYTYTRHGMHGWHSVSMGGGGDGVVEMELMELMGGVIPSPTVCVELFILERHQEPGSI